jgi:hypothetical protein
MNVKVKNETIEVFNLPWRMINLNREQFQHAFWQELQLTNNSESLLWTRQSRN